MVVDTGSDVNWIQCLPCANCYEQSEAFFDPSASSSYTPLSCQSPQCLDLGYGYACANSTISSSSNATGSGGNRNGGEGTCLYESWYGDNSFSIGDFATETVAFSPEAEFSGVSIGCGHDNEGLFYGSAGILGLGAGSLSFVSQVSARSLSYCLVDRDSIAASTLRIGSGHGGRAEITAPLIRNGVASPYYYVGMTGISVGGKMLDVPPSTFAVDESNWGGGVILDTGTIVTRLFGKVYAALRDAFRARTAALPAAKEWSIFDTCYNLSGMESVEVPTVALHFPRGQELQLPAKNYLIPVDDAGTHCLAFAPSSVPANIIGSVQQQGIRVSIDLVRSQVGFTRRMC
ncbi:protein ASPARTIC PROTEASE IN GUARD CELL 1-like [Curcuma longa]|uniref:protein ASPARTIC PROTEASE IN GUARD CELL 1-like n=1 Tax=Curcuma longa TaxID=136217 RepID=UPI003D9E3B02